ncbi:insulin [Erpetoichthys calabaricus]|uniref:insulin n=1 Tax=Erpetoichthys calabaricus TaxID=27687 RepID=UPI00109F21F1|nr:insulin [Erpetoichthys calabaricus]
MLPSQPILSLTMLMLIITAPYGTQGGVTQHLCGAHLVEALFFVCGEKGFFYTPGRGKREEAVEILMKQDAPYSRDARLLLEQSIDDGKAKRGIVEQCCYYSCTYYDLENYCNS